jgi:sulfhydrogenase subunit beta (sulfur reductase)
MTTRIELNALGALFESLRRRGFSVLGPTIRDGAIVYDEIASLTDLPIGWTDEQQAGSYRLKKRKDQAYLGFVVGPQSWKKFLHPASQRLFAAKKNKKGFEITAQGEPAHRYAFFGVRACELEAISIQDKVFLGGTYVEPSYKARRESLFIIAANCTQAGGTCFCASMETGPRVGRGYDLALTEIITDDQHYFLVDAGSAYGQEVLNDIPKRRARSEECEAGNDAIAQAEAHMGRHLNTNGIEDLLLDNLEHARWDNIGNRCLSCANCTMVCPTCFCVSVEDHTSLDGQETERVRKWDSCFSSDFSYIHGGNIRRLTRSRYRQWLTHKLASWTKQFGTSGCVGCGRCITWCPVGIDLTEEVRSIRDSTSNGVL